jgi:hypothetical protein
MFELEYYLLKRISTDGIEYQIVSVTPGNDPLYGNGSWDMCAGPFTTWDDAANAVPNENDEEG